VELGASDHERLLQVAKHVHLVQFKPNDIIAKQDEI